MSTTTSNYDYEAAVKSLDSIMLRACTGSGATHRQLALVKTDSNLVQTLSVTLGGEPQRHRLVYQTSDAEDSVEEVVLHIQGILCTKNLPPIDDRIKLRNFAARMYLQQNITITGAGLPRFDDAIESLHIIQSVFAREYQENQLETYHPATHHGFTSIDASNRYFSTRSDISSDDHLVFPTSIDPYGFLHELLSNDLTYAPDNVVQYHQQIGNIMLPFDPAKFRIGDIVEVQLSFMAIPVRQKHRVRVMLRSLALISNKHSKDAHTVARLQDIGAGQPKPVRVLKRRVGYDEPSNSGAKKRQHEDDDDMAAN